MISAEQIPKFKLIRANQLEIGDMFFCARYFDYNKTIEAAVIDYSKETAYIALDINSYIPNSELSLRKLITEGASKKEVSALPEVPTYMFVLVFKSVDLNQLIFEMHVLYPYEQLILLEKPGDIS